MGKFRPTEVIFSANKYKIENGKPTFYYLILNKGKYFLEVYGAQGGNSTINSNRTEEVNVKEGGKGGYSSGILKLTEKTSIFVYVGSKGTPELIADHESTKGLFGGSGGIQLPCNNCSNGIYGGGASDIRIGQNTLNHRVIVAGGGGGASGGKSDLTMPGGDAGGLFGFNGYGDIDKNKEGKTCMAQGANQTSGGITSITYWNNGQVGSFGLGGDTIQIENGYNFGGSGGGGWYGGAGGGHRVAGGGGSGFVFTVHSEVPKDFKLDEKYYLTHPTILSGRDFLPNGETGHRGDGSVIITLLNEKMSTCNNIFMRIHLFSASLLVLNTKFSNMF